MENGKIKIRPRNPASGTQEPNFPVPPPVPPVSEENRRFFFRVKPKNTGYDKLISRLSESEKKNKKLKQLLFFGFPALLILSFLLVYLLTRPSAPAVGEAGPGEDVATEAGSSILRFLSEYDLVEKGVFSQDQTIPGFLEKYRLPRERISQIVEIASREGVIQLKTGREYLLFRKKNNERGIDFFVYEMDAYRYSVFQIFPKVDFQILDKVVEERTQRVSGIIKTNLLEAVLSAGLPYEILQKMEDALAWSVDFYHLRPGDKFKMIFDEKLADRKTVEVGQLRAIYFSTNDREYYAFLFDENGEPAYFSDYGRPMKTTFLKSPLQYGRITSHFNLKRLHPVDDVVKPHFGTDYAAEEGTEIHSVADGEVEAASFSSGNGNFVKIRHDNTYETQYLHMQKFAPGVTQGKKVKQGEVIGYVGQTGKATGPHVCFRFWKKGVQVDHLKEDIVLPVRFPKEALQHFIAHRDSLMQELNEISF